MKFYTITTEDTMKATYPGATLYPCVDCGLRVCLAADLLDTGEGNDYCCCPKCKAQAEVERTTQNAHWDAYQKAIRA